MTFNLNIQNSLKYQLFITDKTIKLQDLFDFKYNNNRYALWDIQKYNLDGTYTLIARKKIRLFTNIIQDTFERDISTDEQYTVKNTIYYIRGLQGTISVNPITCDYGKGPLNKTDNCTNQTDERICNNSYQDTGTSKLRCKYDSSSPLNIDKCNISTNTVSELEVGSGIYCSQNSVVQEIQKCETGTGKKDNSSLDKTNICSDISDIEQCNQYYIDSGNNILFRCKYDGSSCNSSTNPVTLVNGSYCSEKAVFYDRDNLETEINKKYGTIGSSSFTETSTPKYGDDISQWDVIQVKNMSKLFQDKNITDNKIESWVVTDLKYADSMFDGSTGSNLNLNTWTMNSNSTCFNFNRNSSILSNLPKNIDSSCNIPYIPNISTTQFSNFVQKT